MIKIFKVLSVFVTVFSVTATAQPTKLNYSLMRKLSDARNHSRMIAVLVKGDTEEIRQITESSGGIFKYASGGIASVTVPLYAVTLFNESEKIERVEHNDYKMEVMNDTMIIHNNILPVRYGWGPLGGTGYTGNGVVAGIIDTGIDFTHPDFKNINGTTRVKYIWDHNLTSANPPQPYNYGREFTDTDIDNGQATAHVDYYNGHGTHVSGIVAGNGLAVNNYSGVAPNADIIMVSFNLNLPDENWLNSIADGVHYIFTKAQAMGKPCVINISAGTYYGSHDGKDLQAQLIDSYLTQQNGRSVVCAAGNAGSLKIHLGYNVINDSLFTWFGYAAPGIYIELWADTADMNNMQFSVGADKTSPAFEFRGRIPFSSITQHLGVLKEDTLFNNGNRIGIVESYGELIGDRYSMIYFVKPDSTSYYWRLITMGSGKFDLWSFNMVSTGLPNSSVFPDIVRYKLPDLTQTIVSSFTCSDKVIAVGNFNNRVRYTDVNGNQQYVTPGAGMLAASSSKGPTRDGRIKPDITATGDVLLSCIRLADIPAFLANQPHKLAAGGKHFRDGGTSTSSPVVAGVAALYLEKNPNASYQDVKDAILNCSRTDQFTGTNLPDNTWGYGKLDALSAVAGCAVGINENNDGGSYLQCFPNPMNESTTLFFHYTNSEAAALYIAVSDMMGRVVKKHPVQRNVSSVSLSKDELMQGIYMVSLIQGSKITAGQKLVVY